MGILPNGGVDGASVVVGGIPTTAVLVGVVVDVTLITAGLVGVVVDVTLTTVGLVGVVVDVTRTTAGVTPTTAVCGSVQTPISKPIHIIKNIAPIKPIAHLLPYLCAPI
jgi:hypothetical protein